MNYTQYDITNNENLERNTFIVAGYRLYVSYTANYIYYKDYFADYTEGLYQFEIDGRHFFIEKTASSLFFGVADV